jgi:hypothetical protein
MDIKREIIKRIYDKEREYQKCCFGEYEHLNSLNFASFLIFIDEYLQKAKKAYCGPWKKDNPEWLQACKEMSEGSGPFDAYAELIKVFALSGAALETFSVLRPDKWREDPESEGKKWKE